MAKTKRVDVSTVLNETTTAVRRTNFDLVLRYSNEHGGWQASIGGHVSDRCKPFVDALRDDVLTPLLMGFAQSASAMQGDFR